MIYLKKSKEEEEEEEEEEKTEEEEEEEEEEVGRGGKRWKDGGALREGELALLHMFFYQEIADGRARQGG